MTETYTTMVRYWVPRLKPYPNVSACIGTEVGYFNHRFWWHAIGDVQVLFKTVERDMVTRLNTMTTDTYHYSIHYCLYMIGRSHASAIPTIMFFCDEKEPRRNAKEIVCKTVLHKLPGFRAGHQAHQPEVGLLIQPATSAAGTHHPGSETEQLAGKSRVGTFNPLTEDVAGTLELDSSNSSFKIYCDPSIVKSIGMPIFVDVGSGAMRRATANTVWDGQRYVGITVSHVFHGNLLDQPKLDKDSDSDYDFGSDTTSEHNIEDLEDPNLSDTISEEPTHTQSNPYPSGGNSQKSIEETVPIRSKSPIWQVGRTLETTATKSQTKRGTSIKLSAAHTPSVDELRFVGCVIDSSIDQDWALFEIQDRDVLKLIQGTSSEALYADARHALNGGSTAIVAHTSRGAIHGRITEASTYMRLSGSTTYQEVYIANLDEPLTWGDCGVWFTDAASEQVYGHVVASSETGTVAYIMTARHGFAAASSRREKPGSLPINSERAAKTEQRVSGLSALDWTWSSQHKDYYYINSDLAGNVEYVWASQRTSAAPTPALVAQQTYDRQTASFTDVFAKDSNVQTRPDPVPYDIRQQLPNFIAGTPSEGWYEEMDPSYRMRTGPEAREFFRVGRVFSMLYTEGQDDDAFTVIRMGGHKHTQIRRFVVVSTRRGYVHACAISTYRSQGTLIRGCDPTEHALIYNRGVDPEGCYFQGERERGLTKEPIEVDAADSSVSLTKESRIRFGKIYSIEWNVKVQDIGMVVEEDLGTLREHHHYELQKWDTAN